MGTARIIVRALWDGEAGVFVATSDDVPGLVTEAATWEALQAKLDGLIPELLDLNGRSGDDTPEAELVVEEHRTLRLHA